MAESSEQMMVRMALDGQGFMDGLRATAAAEKKWGEELSASLAIENKKRNEIAIIAATQRNAAITAIEAKAQAERIAKIVEEKELMEGLVAEENALRLAADKAVAAGMVSDYKKYAAAREAISDQIVAAEEAKNAAIIAADKITIEQSWSRYQANVANKIATDKMYVEQYAARMAEKREIDAIANGSGGFGWAAGAAAGSAAGGIAPSIHGAKSGLQNTIAMRELQVMMREISRGNWSRVLGSFTIFANAFGGIMKSIIASMFSFTGIVIAGIGVAAYEMWQNIKGFNKELDEFAKEAAKPFGDKAGAMREAITKSGAKVAEYRDHIKSLANAHESLSSWAERSAKEIEKNAVAMERLLKSRGDLQLAGVNLAEHMGMMTPGAANDARDRISLATFTAIERTKFDANAAEGRVLNAAYAQAQTQNPILAQKASVAMAAAYGTDANGNVDSAALARNTQINEHLRQKTQIEKDEARFTDLNHIKDRTPGQVAANLVDSLLKQKEAALEQLKNQIAMEKKIQAQTEAQHTRNMAAQTAAEGAYKEAVRQLDENNASLVKLKTDVDEYAEKKGDFVLGMKALYSDLQTKALNQQSAMSTAEDKSELSMPTIADLAGSKFEDQLNEDYGAQKFGRRGRLIAGKYSLSSGDGPFGQAARGLELSKKQEAWDIANGNSEWTEKKDANGNSYMALTGGQAYQDKQNAIAYANQLKSAGMDTPEMRQKDMQESLTNIFDEIKALNTLASGKGINLADGT
jgi:hypothetical protein